MQEEWKRIDNTRYYVSNFGRIKKANPKNGYRFIKPFRHKNKFIVKIEGKQRVVSRLVANAFIRPLKANERVFHKNNMEWDNYYRNLQIMGLKELGKRTGHISRSKRVVEVKDGEIIRDFRSIRECGRKLYMSYQTVLHYCNGLVKKPMYNLMFEDDYFDSCFKKKRGRPKKCQDMK